MSLSYYTSGAETAARNRARMRATGRTPKGHLLWTQREDEIVRAIYPDYEALRRLLPSRTYCAIRHRVGDLNIANSRRRWSAAEKSRLRRLYPDATPSELEAAFPGRTFDHIKQMARYFGFYRRRRRLQPTGIPIIDAVRDRAFELNYSMVDVDVLIGKGSYFQKAGWHYGNNVNKVAVWRAIEAMGGRLTVEWDDT